MTSKCTSYHVVVDLAHVLIIISLILQLAMFCCAFLFSSITIGPFTRETWRVHNMQTDSHKWHKKLISALHISRILIYCKRPYCNILLLHLFIIMQCIWQSRETLSTLIFPWRFTALMCKICVNTVALFRVFSIFLTATHVLSSLSPSAV